MQNNSGWETVWNWTKCGISIYRSIKQRVRNVQKTCFITKKCIASGIYVLSTKWEILKTNFVSYNLINYVKHSSWMIIIPQPVLKIFHLKVLKILIWDVHCSMERDDYVQSFSCVWSIYIHTFSCYFIELKKFDIFCIRR